ncbi:MAG: hypothetical protein ACT4P4_22850 [Betaproteobacteria bacterium]
MTRIALVFLLLVSATPARASEDDAFGYALTLIQTIVRLGTQTSPEQGIADVLAGRNSEANRAIAGLFEGATSEVPPQYRDQMAAIGRDLASYASRHPVTRAIDTLSTERSLQARKDLTAMGLRYYDEKQYLEAVERGDQLAVELFIAGKGVNLATTDWRGRNAVDIARARGNAPLADLLARNLPAQR